MIEIKEDKEIKELPTYDNTDGEQYHLVNISTKKAYCGANVDMTRCKRVPKDLVCKCCIQEKLKS